MRTVSVFMSIALLLSIVPIAALAGEETTVGFGSLKFDGIFQTWYQWNESESADDGFLVKRARLLLSGTLVPEKVKYFVQFDGTLEKFLLDTKMIFTCIPNTAITVGRFIPAFTLYMPAHTGKLDFINYPLTTSQYAMWRQTGVQGTTNFGPVDLTLGLYNGYQASFNADTLAIGLAGNDWADDNDSKDFLVALNVTPIEGLRFGVFHWQGMPSVDTEDEEYDFDATRTGGLIDYHRQGLHLAAEYVMGSNGFSEIHDDLEDIDSNAWMAQASYAFNPTWEILARYEGADPNTDTDDDGIDALTLGVNYSIESINARIGANYIMKGEEYEEELDNDQFVVQFQYVF